jgi:DNA-binding protein HU-beta
MNVTGFKKAISEKFQCGDKDAGTIYKKFVSIIDDTLVSGEEVELQGIGTLKIVERKERTGMNPKTKEPIIIPAKKAIKFKTCATINRKLNS